MEIVKAFSFNQLTKHITITGTYENPLFRGSDVADTVNLKNFHTSIASFNDNEKVLRTVDTPGGVQNVVFLTERM